MSAPSPGGLRRLVPPGVRDAHLGSMELGTAGGGAAVIHSALTSTSERRSVTLDAFSSGTLAQEGLRLGMATRRCQLQC